MSLVFDAVASLLNPCQCSDVWHCGCRTSASDAPHINSELASQSPAQSPAQSPNGNNHASAPAPSDGLETLARAAVAVLLSPPLLTPRSSNHLKQIASSSGTNDPTSLSRSCRPSDTATSPTSPVLDLPPLVFPEVPSPTPVVPPFSTFTTLAGSGCTCGLTCQCPGCSTHHPHPGVDLRNAQDCMTCADPTPHVIDQSSRSSFMKSPVSKKFLAVAERIPPPPIAGGKPVELPKLCCGGSCGCGGACGCSGDCNGCCQFNEGNEIHHDIRKDSTSVTVGLHTE